MHRFALALSLYLLSGVAASASLEQQKIEYLEHRVSILTTENEKLRTQLESLDGKVKQAVEEKIFALDEKYKKSESHLNTLVENQHRWLTIFLAAASLIGLLLTLFIAVISFLGYRNILQWVKRTVEKIAHERVNTELTSATRAKEKFERETVNTLQALKNQFDTLMAETKQTAEELFESIKSKAANQTPLTKDEKQALVREESKIEAKPKERYTDRDWIVQGLAAWNNQKYEEALYCFKKPEQTAYTQGIIAEILTKLHRYSEAEAMYEQAIKADPLNANNLGNYANFLKNIRKKYDEAEATYEQAITADPDHAIHLGNYANFLTDIRKKHDEAEGMYKRAIMADPLNANNLGNYAVFLTNIRKKHDEAEAMYNRLIMADPLNANFLGNYANFLTRKNPDKAEAMYEQAIEADQHHANNLGNYANFLTRKNPDKAEAMYKRAIKADPHHANNLVNYANFLKNIRKEYDKAEAMYKQAIMADPSLPAC